MDKGKFIYARYSSGNQREESIEGQLQECKEYAERNDIMILGTYIDRALSAEADNRPEFQHMIKNGAKGLFDVVLVWKSDRFRKFHLTKREQRQRLIDSFVNAVYLYEDKIILTFNYKDV